MLSSLSFIRIYWLLVSVLIASFSYAQAPDLQVVTESSPPYQIMLNGEVAGLATDKVKNILAKAGLSASFSIYPWARAYKKALHEPNTLIYSIAKNTSRNESFHWLMPVTQYRFGLVKLTERTDILIDDLKDIKHYRFAVQRDDISHEWLQSKGLIEDKHFITCSDIDCSWLLLLNKKVDLIIESPELIVDMLKRYGKAPDSASFIMAIPELAITGYLASNKKITPHILDKLKAAIDNQ
tara:strand:- start:756 stop:1472 length:717 start_codon:yes stop_codon:yes gene_type:complete